MTRLCERPGCSLVAEMSYGFDAEHLVVWIDAFDHAGASRAGVLCRRHADAMVVPLGWMLDDRRVAAPQLFKVNATPVAGVPRRRAGERRAPVGEQLALDASAADDHRVDDGADDETADDPGPVAPWKPTFDQTDDLDGLLEARGPLLARAFAGRDRSRRSS